MIADPHRTYPCRCRKCWKRKRLRANRIDGYRCDNGRCRGTYRIDRYRDSRENTKDDVCMCPNYHFPHHRGRGWCEANESLTAEDFQRRHEEGRWTK